MYSNYNNFTPFTEYDLSFGLRAQSENIVKTISSDRSVLEHDEEEYVEAKIKEYTLPLLTIDTNNISVSQTEKNIPAEYFPGSFDVDRGRSFPKPVITFHIPFVGDPQLFRNKPSSYLMGGMPQISISGNEVQFEVINFSNDTQTIANTRDTNVKNLQQQIEYINNDLKQFNSQLETSIRNAYKAAKTKFNNQDDVLSKLGNKIK